MRLRSLLIFGIGYVVGSKAGQDRYQQIVGSVRELAESDAVRGYADRALDIARRTAAAARPEVADENGDIADTNDDEDRTNSGGGRTRARRSG